MLGYSISFWFLIFTEGLMAAGYSLSFPFLAVYLSSVKGLPIGQVGLFLSLSMLTASVSNVFGGELSDRFGRKKIMTGSLALRSFLILLMALSVKIDLNPYVFFILHPLGLFAGSFFNPAARAYVADITEPKKRMQAYSFMRIGTNAGWAAGPALGGFIAASSYTVTFTLTALVYLVCLLILSFSLKENKILEISENNKNVYSYFNLKIITQTLYKDKNFLYFCVFTFIIASVMSQLVVPMSMYSKKYLLFEEKQIGLLFTLNGAMVVFFQYFISRFFSKYPLTFGLAAGSLFYGIGYFMFGFSVFYHMALLAMVIVTLGELMVSPGLQTLSANMASSRLRGRYMGIHSMIQQIGNSFGIFIGSFLIDKLAGIWAPSSWAFMLAAGITAALGFMRLGTMIKEDKKPEDADLVFEKNEQ
ncbi:MAG: MFS transporter [Elusimicrobia bacterium]|nr:MFS transporter [Elusimicrobiota bacterium]